MSDTDSTPWQWRWANSNDAEIWSEGFATRDEAIAAARASRIDDGAIEDGHVSFTIAEGRPMDLVDDVFDIDEVIEYWDDANQDFGDDDGELHMEPTQEQLAELSAALAATLKAWRTKHDLGRAWMLNLRSEEDIVLPIDTSGI